MTPRDLSALHRASFETPRPWTEDEFVGFLTKAGVFLCQRPAGFALGRTMADEAELLTLAVAPESRRQGHGAALLTEFEAEALRRGATSAFLEVADGNTAAATLYDAHGYRRTGRRRGYYRRPDGARIDALLFAKPLK